MLIGVDAGGTCTRAALVDRGGRCWGFGTAGGGNPVSRGPGQAAQAIDAAVRAALDGARSDAAPEVAVLAMAGAGTAPALAVPALRAAGRVEVVHDLLATFCSGTPRQSGYVLVAGTGAAALRVEQGRIAASADGLGWLIGDAGSGFWIGHAVVRAALAAMDGFGPATAMAAMVRRELDLPEGDARTPDGQLLALRAAVDAVYQMRPVELSRYAQIAFRAAGAASATTGFPAAADPVAVDILTRARDHLVRTLGAVWRGECGGPVVLGGGIARRLPGLSGALADALGAREIILVPDGVIGAAVLALRAAGIEVDGAVFDRLTGSIAEHR